MATIRSSVPSRLRQLLSADGSLGPSLKLDSEPVSFLFFFFLFCTRLFICLSTMLFAIRVLSDLSTVW